MKTKLPLALLVFLLTIPASTSIAAATRAVAKDNRVNVRAQPSLSGEVITQLEKGEEVFVLEEVTLTKPGTNEPAKWARIRMPGNTPVWVFAPYVDASSRTVKASRLNLRAGPGENFSVVGRLERGSKVGEIRRVEDWMEIETPESAFAFVAADLLTMGEEAPALELARQEPPPAQQRPVPQPAPEPEPEPQPEATPKPQVEQIAAAPVELPLAEVPPAGLEMPPPPPVQAEPVRIVTPQKSEPQLTTRTVRREGIVRSTVSIQAPTYFELLNPDNRRTMNFLYAENAGLKLKDYLGRRIVVSGQEAIDPRWPKTPVIEVETLELISNAR
jgi:SH3-like domain-containing protein